MPADPEAVVSHLRFWLLDSVSPERAREIIARVSRHVAVPCRLGGGRGDVVAGQIEGRAQVNALELLQALEAGTDEVGGAEIGLTACDLALPIFTHVFGLARHHGRAAVVSLARLCPEFYGLPSDPAITLTRAAREIMHELGHVLGLEHCSDFECVMRFAADVESIDLRGDDYCALCRERLPAGLLHG